VDFQICDGIKYDEFCITGFGFDNVVWSFLATVSSV